MLDAGLAVYVSASQDTFSVVARSSFVDHPIHRGSGLFDARNILCGVHDAQAESIAVFRHAVHSHTVKVWMRYYTSLLDARRLKRE